MWEPIVKAIKFQFIPGARESEKKLEKSNSASM
jgi:hypothetical protein